MNNWFKVGMYSKLLLIIALLLSVNLVLTAFTSHEVKLVNAANDNSYNPPAPDEDPAFAGFNDEREKPEYDLKLEDNFIVVQEIGTHRVVGTLTYNTSLGRMITKDNE